MVGIKSLARGGFVGNSYISDYYLTIYAAKGYREIGHFYFESGYELTPQYQKDINELRPISRRHVILLVVYSLVIMLAWWFTHLTEYFQEAYLIYLGMFLLIEAAVHMRHFRNISLIREVRRNGGVDGQISYKKTLTYRISANELYSFSFLYLLFSILTSSWFFLGGALMSFGTGLKHSRLARKAAKEA